MATEFSAGFSNGADGCTSAGTTPPPCRHNDHLPLVDVQVDPLKIAYIVNLMKIVNLQEIHSLGA